MARRFRQLELDEAELDFILEFDPEAAPAFADRPQLEELLRTYRKYANTVQSYISDGLL